jgi:hypothetical protein
MTYILLGALIALVALFYLILWLRVRQGPEPRLRGVLQYQDLLDRMAFANVAPYGLQLVRTLGTLVAVISAGVTVGNEYDWGTAALAVRRSAPGNLGHGRLSYRFATCARGGCWVGERIVVLCHKA